MNYPLTAIVGPSGSGKSSSIRNLPPAETIVINVERKTLPFKAAYAFGKNNVEVSNVQEFDAALALALGNNSIRYVVIDSFQKYVELLLNFSKAINKGYEIYNYYNSRIFKTLETIKDNKDKFVFVMGLDERVESVGPTGTAQHSRRIKVSGKEWEGAVEKEFTVVLFTDVRREEKKEVADYRFLTNNDGTNSAKSPPEMFPLYIPNDLFAVAKRLSEYYNISKNAFVS